jgi:hypothetical protein
MKHALLTGLCLGFLLAGAGTAQNRAHGAMFARVEGSDVKVAIQVRIDSGLHLYHGPTVEDMSPDGAVGKPTTVELHGDGIEWSAVKYPAPQLTKQDLGDGESAKHINEHIGTIVLATSSAVGSVSGSIPGKALAYMRVRVGPGAKRLTRTDVVAHSAA